MSRFDRGCREEDIAKLVLAARTFAARAHTPGASDVPDDGTVTFFMKDVREIADALKRVEYPVLVVE